MGAYRFGASGMSAADHSGTASPPQTAPRYGIIDVAKGVAILAMVGYHAAFDLSLRRLIGVDVINDPDWTIVARLIAGTFVTLVGVNLALSTRNGLRPRRHLVRFAMIAGSAALVSFATFRFDPSTFIYFGILHLIAVASILGLAFVRLPPLVTALTGLAILLAPHVIGDLAAFDAPWLVWIGLSANPPPSLDYVPLLPWFGLSLLGIAAGRLIVRYAAGTPFAAWRPETRVNRWLVAAGRWTLPIYLVHQPILFGMILLVEPMIPPDIDRERAHFVGQCRPACAEQGYDGPSCTSFCTCLFEGIYDTDLFEVTSPGQLTPDQSTRFDALRRQCSAGLMPGER